MEAGNFSKQQSVVIGGETAVAFLTRTAKCKNLVEKSVVGRAENVEKRRIVCVNMPIAKKRRPLANDIAPEQ